MERLTFEGNFCEIAQCAEIPGGSFCEDGACSQWKVWERLKQYEDTGLEPEEITAVDAVKVVRCGECVHWDAEKLYCHHPAGLSYCEQVAAEMGFCCFGERRNGNG